MLTVQFNKSAEAIKVMRDAATAFTDENGGDFRYDVTNVDRMVKAAENNNDIMNAIMSKCVG